MKSDIFSQYVDRVGELFQISRTDVFTKSKKREFVDARYMIYYLCFKRPMAISYIQKFMADNGYSIPHSSIIYGISTVTKRIEQDQDYKQVIKDIERAVFI